MVFKDALNGVGPSIKAVMCGVRLVWWAVVYGGRVKK